MPGLGITIYIDSPMTSIENSHFVKSLASKRFIPKMRK